MGQIAEFFGWLFGTRMGVFALLGGGILVCLLIAFPLERKTRARYKNHKRSEDDWSIFDDEDGWSEFEDDNK